MPGGKLYAVRVGRQPGIYTTWGECQKHIEGVPGAKYKSFITQADAEAFLQLADGPKTVVVAPTPGATAPGPQVPPQSGPQTGSASVPQMWQPLPGAAPIPFSATPVPTPTYNTGTHIWTDGSCIKNAGGWAFVVYQDGQMVAENYGYVESGPNGEKPTNNRAEITAIVKALQSPHAAGSVTIHSDSEFSINCITNWAGSWERNGWMTKSGQPVKNPDLIKAAVALYDKKRHTFHHVFGHVGIPGNERADQLANQGRLMTPTGADVATPAAAPATYPVAVDDYDIPDDY